MSVLPVFNPINQLVFFCTFLGILILVSYLCMMGKETRDDDVYNKIVNMHSALYVRPCLCILRGPFYSNGELIEHFC